MDSELPDAPMSATCMKSRGLGNKPASAPDRVVTPTLPTIVTVIEAGPLERQVCLLAESLRRWGGRLSRAPMFALKTRRGPDPSATTRDLLDTLNVQYCIIDRDDGFEWFPYLNKTAAVRHVAARQDGSVAWLDADILILGEPSELLLDCSDLHGPKFAACPSDKNIGTARDDDEFAPYFRAVCEAVGVDFTSLPYILTEKEHVSIRAYWNSGVYAFASKSGLAELHHKFTCTILAKGIASHESKLFFSDQISLGLAAQYLGLKHKNLPLTYNFHIQPDDADTQLRTVGRGIRLLHYHGCLWPEAFDKLCIGVEAHYPDVAEWLRGHGPLVVNMAPIARLYRKALSVYRQRQYDFALRRVHIY